MRTFKERIAHAANAIKSGVHVGTPMLRELVLEMSEIDVHWAKRAAEAHREQIYALPDGEEKNHLIHMIDVMTTQPMSIGKANRWLGWIQATLVHEFKVASLEEMKQHNKKHSE